MVQKNGEQAMIEEAKNKTIKQLRLIKGVILNPLKPLMVQNQLVKDLYLNTESRRLKKKYH